MYTVKAYQVANAVNVKQCKARLPWQLMFQDSDELYYQIAEDKFIYVFQYGMVSFFNFSETEIEVALRTLKPYCTTPLTKNISEETKVVVESQRLKVDFNSITLPSLDQEMIRLVMLNTSQSVALDNYSNLTEKLLIETNEHTKYLEQHGKLDISGNKLKRFIGKVLNIKNKISENLYIFDAPDIVWDDERLNKLNQDLKLNFDLKDRYHLIHDRIEIIKENLELFKDIMDHKESSKLEWIIIILILVEVVDMLVAKMIL